MDGWSGDARDRASPRRVLKDSHFVAPLKGGHIHTLREEDHCSAAWGKLCKWIGFPSVDLHPPPLHTLLKPYTQYTRCWKLELVQ